jgi:hypothetical protein
VWWSELKRWPAIERRRQRERERERESRVREGHRRERESTVREGNKGEGKGRTAQARTILPACHNDTHNRHASILLAC